ncbi:hypothetical protein BHM03_00021176 [Ensete ventricosum]|nr:hypothetical protein BHM03_00021176 [Ensete ventricosum]
MTKPNSIPKEANGQRENRLEAPTIFSKGAVSDRSASRPREINCDREGTPTASRFRRRRPISHRRAKPSAATRATTPATKPNKKETSIDRSPTEPYSKGFSQDQRKEIGREKGGESAPLSLPVGG